METTFSFPHFLLSATMTNASDVVSNVVKCVLKLFKLQNSLNRVRYHSFMPHLEISISRISSCISLYCIISQYFSKILRPKNIKCTSISTTLTACYSIMLRQYLARKVCVIRLQLLKFDLLVRKILVLDVVLHRTCLNQQEHGITGLCSLPK